MRIRIVTAMSFIVVSAAFGQMPQFSAASIRAIENPRGAHGVLRRSGDRILWLNTPLAPVVMYAYDLTKPWQFSGDRSLSQGRTWFDFEANVTGSPDDAQLRVRFQSLLENRFGLKVHRETKEIPSYLLSVLKDGPNEKLLRPADSGAKIMARGAALGPGEAVFSFELDGSLHLLGKAVTMQQLAAQLVTNLKGPVEDQTQLAGRYDFDLRYGHFDRTESRDILPGAPIGTALGELGLKLEKGKASVEVLVVDHIQKLTPN